MSTRAEQDMRRAAALSAEMQARTKRENAAHTPGARLIAAAPEMLKVLQALQESASYWSEYDVPLGIVDDINAAIKAATGE